MALNANIMSTDDIMSGAGGSAFLTIGENRFNLFNILKFQGKVDTIKKERGLLGAPKRVSYLAGWKGTWTATVDLNTSTYARMMQMYKDTGRFPDFEIQTVNKNFTGSTGQQQVIYKGCTLDSTILSAFDVENDSGLQMDISGTFDDFEIPEGFTEMPGYRVS